MEPSAARRTWRLLEPYHAVIYFAPEAKERYEAAGLKGDEDCRTLEDLMEPIMARIHRVHGVAYPNPIGLPIPV